MTRPPKASPPSSARLFSDAHADPHNAPPAGIYTANIDGASRGNPGPASYAVVIRDPEAKIVLELAKRLGRETNNVAEYYALLAALDYATTNGIRAMRIRSDSELLVRQMQGRYKVKSADLKPMHERATKLSHLLGYFAIEHVRREQNRDADALANVALDSGPVSEASPSRAGSENAPTQPTRPPPSTRRIQARVVRGLLEPVEPLGLPEGSEVVIDLKMPAKRAD